ncbi:exopolyphosphatase-like protein [Xylaria acuta]|nr:exopolyphosphatase-like protein [Xylaria acuta]
MIDLDSLCSALLLAYFHTYSPPPTKRASAGDGVGSSIDNTLHIPVCHLQRADLALRPEFTAVLRGADVKGEDVLTLEDVPHHGGATTKNSSSGIRPEDTRWLLVDHNVMTGTLGEVFGSRVFGCVDHHPDEDAVPRDAEIRVIEKSGSCMSLVVERCADIWEALATGTNTNTNTSTSTPPQSGGPSESGEIIDAQLARLALAPILIDTTNLEDKNKTTAHDERAVELAEGKIAARAEKEEEDREEEEGGGGRYDRDTFFKRIMDLKEDIAEMSFRDVFRKDYKEWRVEGFQNLRLGTSSIPRGFGYLVDTKSDGDAAAFAGALRDWGAEKDGQGKMDLVVVSTGFQDEDGKFCRELLVWARSEPGVRAAKLFEENWADKLGLEAWGDGALDDLQERDQWRRCWAQRAVEHSRKQIAPMLRDALGEIAGG